MAGVESQATFHELLAQYDLALARLGQSHDELLARVSELQSEVARKNDLLAHKERLAALGEVAAGVAHEIRNPLGGIRLYLDLLDRGGLSADGVATVEKIRRVVSRLDRVVRDVLLHSRELQVQARSVSLCSVIMDAVNCATQELGDGGITLEVEVDEGQALLDPDLTARLVLNLLANAVQAMPDGGTLRVLGRLTTESCIITVEDEGPGIAPERLGSLFSPFFTTKAGGTGLGLSLCRKIAHAQGGSIEAQNRPQGGARFVCRLPRVRT